MTPEQIHARLTTLLGPKAGALVPPNKDAAIRVEVKDLLEVATALRDDAELKFDFLMNHAGVDLPAKNQIDLVLHLYSYPLKHTLVVKAALDRAAPEAPTLSALWPTADWLEREQFDLMGIKFTGHPDMRRIMMPDDWIGHPLRKDYAEPASWHGISMVRESPLDGLVRLDEARKKLAASKAESEKAAAAAAAPAAAPAAAAAPAPAPAKKETP